MNTSPHRHRDTNITGKGGVQRMRYTRRNEYQAIMECSVVEGLSCRLAIWSWREREPEQKSKVR